MKIQAFIEKAIEGGWRPKRIITGDHNDSGYRDEEILLDPEAWKAVGKVEGWACLDYRHGFCDCAVLPEIQRMHRMIDALAEGKTVEQYLETL